MSAHVPAKNAKLFSSVALKDFFARFLHLANAGARPLVEVNRNTAAIQYVSSTLIAILATYMVDLIAGDYSTVEYG